MQWLVSLLQTMPAPFPAFAERFDKSPIVQLEQLSAFVYTRASYIAQTAMYGYLKTRMGTSYRKVFEDQKFAGVIHASTVRLFSSCLCDLAVFSAAYVCRSHHKNDPEKDVVAQELALYLYDTALANGLSEASQNLIESGLRERFTQRLQTTNWHRASESMHAFSWSEVDIVRHAPVIESYKKLDAEIVQNSVHFRWVDIYEQARQRYATQALHENWMQHQQTDKSKQSQLQEFTP